jgi:hypothetical protein
VRTQLRALRCAACDFRDRDHCAPPEPHRVPEQTHRCLSRLRFLRSPGGPPLTQFRLVFLRHARLDSTLSGVTRHPVSFSGCTRGRERRPEASTRHPPAIEARPSPAYVKRIGRRCRMKGTARAGIAETAESFAPEGTHREPQSGRHPGQAGRNRGNCRAGAHLLGEIAPGQFPIRPYPGPCFRLPPKALNGPRCAPFWRVGPAH